VWKLSSGVLRACGFGPIGPRRSKADPGDRLSKGFPSHLFFAFGIWPDANQCPKEALGTVSAQAQHGPGRSWSWNGGTSAFKRSIALVVGVRISTAIGSRRVKVKQAASPGLFQAVATARTFPGATCPEYLPLASRSPPRAVGHRSCHGNPGSIRPAVLMGHGREGCGAWKPCNAGSAAGLSPQSATSASLSPGLRQQDKFRLLQTAVRRDHQENMPQAALTLLRPYSWMDSRHLSDPSRRTPMGRQNEVVAFRVQPRSDEMCIQNQTDDVLASARSRATRRPSRPSLAPRTTDHVLAQRPTLKQPNRRTLYAPRVGCRPE